MRVSFACNVNIESVVVMNKRSDHLKSRFQQQLDGGNYTTNRISQSEELPNAFD